MNFLPITLLFITVSTTLFGQDSLGNTARKSRFTFLKTFTDTARTHDNFELSFGQNLLFISSSRQEDILEQESIVLATSSVLFFAELRPHKVMRIPVFLNIATESKQFIVDGEIVNEKASPTFGTGLVFKVAQFDIDKKSRIELEMGPLVSFIVDNTSKIRVAPILASRVKICRGENFVMYMGVNYSLGVKAFGVMYGTGTVF